MNLKLKSKLPTDLTIGRLTKKKLIKWVNEQFLKLEIKGYEVYKIEATRYRGQDYEGGAAVLHIWFKGVNESDPVTGRDCFMCFYRISELENYAKNGYDIYLDFNNRFYTLSQLEIKVSPTKNTKS